MAKARREEEEGAPGLGPASPEDRSAHQPSSFAAADGAAPRRTTAGDADSSVPELSMLEQLSFRVVRQGAVPRHVAFIMDGNRRFAKQQLLPRMRGHELGYSKLEQALQWCFELGVRVVTVYAFSIENFRRSTQEVEALMSLAEDKFDDVS